MGGACGMNLEATHSAARTARLGRAVGGGSALGAAGSVHVEYVCLFVWLCCCEADVGESEKRSRGCGVG
jgi:hypothetical protein